MANKTPSQGRIVHYLPKVGAEREWWAGHLVEGQTVPAIVTAVHADEVICATVFVPAKDSTFCVSLVPQHQLAETDALETPQAPGTWIWPPFV